MLTACKDEPTSGLDSQTAWSICMLLRKLADYGQAVLCTIHQPSSQLFRMFDRLLLLNNHGETVYFGDIGQNAATFIEYFENKGAPACRPEDNPAEWILNVISDSTLKPSTTESSTGKSPVADAARATHNSAWSKRWFESQEHREVQQHLRSFTAVGQITVSSKPSAKPERSEFAASFIQQLVIVTRRIFQEYWRDPTYLYSKLALCAGVVGVSSLLPRIAFL